MRSQKRRAFSLHATDCHHQHQHNTKENGGGGGGGENKAILTPGFLIRFKPFSKRAATNINTKEKHDYDREREREREREARQREEGDTHSWVLDSPEAVLEGLQSRRLLLGLLRL